MLGMTALVCGCQGDTMNGSNNNDRKSTHDDSNMRNNNHSDTMNTGTGSMQRSSNDTRPDTDNMGVQTAGHMDKNAMSNDSHMSGDSRMSNDSRTSNDSRMSNDSHMSGGANMSMPGGMDGTFLKTAASSDMFEIESSRLAVDRTKDASLKQFAQQMVNDHTQTSTQLKELASQKGWTVPTQMTAEHQQQLDMLKNAKGDAFDAMYRTSQMKAHAEAISLFDSASQNCSDAALKNWAGQTLPKLQMHSDMLKQMGTNSMK